MRLAARGSIYDLPASGPPSSWWEQRPHLPYLLPLLAFGLIMAPGGLFGNFGGIDWKAVWHHWHPWIYFIKTVVAGVMIWMFWRHYTKIQWSHFGLAAVVGLVGVPLWVLTEYAAQYVGWSTAPMPCAFDARGHHTIVGDMYVPDVELHDPAARILFLIIRVAGPTLVVPIMEELFYRDFMMRALVGGVRFEDVKVGAFSWLSLIGTAGVFTMSHFQKPSALLWGLMIGVLAVRTKSIGACIIAHGVTNLVLYLYVIYTGDWQFM